MRKENINSRKQRLKQKRNKEKMNRILHKCSWLLLAFSVCMVAILGSHKINTSPYLYIAVGSTVFAIILRIVILFPNRIKIKKVRKA